MEDEPIEYHVLAMRPVDAANQEPAAVITPQPTEELSNVVKDDI
jgi:hypothetical protein